MKRRIRQNVFGNWRGYEGRRCTEFFRDEAEANDWLAGVPKPPQERLALTDWQPIFDATDADRVAALKIVEKSACV